MDAIGAIGRGRGGHRDRGTAGSIICSPTMGVLLCLLAHYRQVGAGADAEIVAQAQLINPCQ
eukprot:1160091-Pelagomonas_calceolata.AAC.2